MADKNAEYPSAAEELARENYGAKGGKLRLQDADPQTQASYRADALRQMKQRLHDPALGAAGERQKSARERDPGVPK